MTMIEKEVNKPEGDTLDMIAEMQARIRTLSGEAAKLAYELSEYQHERSDLESAISDLETRIEGVDQAIRVTRRRQASRRSELNFIVEWYNDLTGDKQNG